MAPLVVEASLTPVVSSSLAVSSVIKICPDRVFVESNTLAHPINCLTRSLARSLRSRVTSTDMTPSGFQVAEIHVVQNDMDIVST